jgi:tRNA-2-methylthio-N6-dimethylallyladenosine synthase
VPQLRGIEKDRPAADIMREVRALVDQGVIEITLLGQNVNAYGVDFGDQLAFSKLLRECGKVEGLERVRFMSPHPRDFTDDVIEAMAQTPNVMPHLHMPLQSGSDKVLKDMRRSYRRDRYLGIIEKVRSAIPNAAITTDIIVGFPGETDEDFAQTIDLVKQAKFSAAYTFQYSKRPGTPAATMPNQIEDDVMATRYNQLHQVQQEISKSENEKLIGTEIELLVSAHEGRHDIDLNRMNGRARDFRLTHFDNSANTARPGDLVKVKVTEGFANHIVAGAPISVIKTRGGEAHTAWVNEQGDKKILLGIPTLASLKSL